MAADKTEFGSFLDLNSTSKFYIEYGGFLSNHLSHGLIALHKLGAIQKTMEEFLQRYSSKLEEPFGDTAMSQKKSCKGIEGLLGARKEFYTLMEYYTEKYKNDYNSNLESLINGEFDHLSDGLIASLLHGLIHLGYGFSEKSPKLVCEGLAYLHHSYVPLKLIERKISIGRGTEDIVEVLRDVGAHNNLKTFMLQEIKTERLMKWHTGNFQRKMFVLFESKADELLQYAARIKTPQLSENFSTEDVVGLGKWLLDSAIFIYVNSTSKNDFILLHGVTATWSLCQILTAMSVPQQALRAVQTLICGILAAYVVTGAAPLKASSDPEMATYKNWDNIIKTTISRECDEHIYKLVQVVYERSQEVSGNAQNDLYKAAANVALNYPLSI